MSRLLIEGGRTLRGEVKVQGSKNSALPILAATYLVNGKSIIHNCPRLSDVECTIKILQNLGCKTERHGTDLIVDSTSASGCEIPENLMREMRSSVIIAGALLSRKKKVVFTYPGGCDIGSRPIDLHIKSFEKLGVNVKEEFCRVLYIEENGIVVSMPYTDLDYIYVKKDGIGSRVMSFETLVIKFLESDLKPQKGSFVGFDGKEAEYSYVLENPRGIRRPDASKGEPTFG